MGTLNARKGRRSGGGQDVEAVLDELYTTPPSDFVARRETLTAAAKTAGRVDDARRIHAARRPTLAAWAANLLLRSQPEESRQFLELGQALREAYQALDAEGLKDLSAQRRRVVSALSRQTAQLAREAGHRLSQSVQQDLEATLRAVLADPDAADQWAGGRLVNALTPPSNLRPSTARSAEKPGTRGRTASSPPARAKDELSERRRARQEQLARAKEAAEAAEQRLREERARRADIDAKLQRARERTEQAHKRMSAAEEQMQQAREEVQRAENKQQEAEEQSRSAADALAHAEREARESAQHVRRMTAGTT
ncbi:hypothetical protein ACIRQF_30430 [Streptomyces sp. NPDC101191]|uniref:hypothetical protein n=1 Tax=Streptomyces sp. NPDC101191 TaxID=3366126 RepID=UPI0038090B28